MPIFPPPVETTPPLPRHARTVLFVPADRPERFEKACSIGADAVVLDLEDGVATNRKNEARANVVAWLTPRRPVLARINARDTPWHAQDLELLQLPGLQGVVVPKAEVLSESLVAACSKLGKSIIPIVETAEGFQNAAQLARTPGVIRLAFGQLDFQVDMGISGDNDALLFFRSHLVLVSRLAGVAPPIDGVTVDIKNPLLLEADALRAKRCGFGGKLCIHPEHVDPINRAFSPSSTELNWARSVLKALNTGGRGVLAVDGKMIDRPVILKAQRLLAVAALWGGSQHVDS